MSDETAKAMSGASASASVVHVFTIPELLQAHGVKSIGIKEMSVKDEKLAGKRSQGSQIQQAQALALQSLAEVDGKKVSTGEGTAEAAFDKMHPKIRELMLTAYVAVNQCEASETRVFLSSQQMKVG